MVCTWTPAHQYSDYVELQARGDGGVLDHFYRPVNNGVKVVGGVIYVRALQPADETLQSPSCSSFLAGEACNIQIALTKYDKVHKFCLDDCDWDEVVNDVGMMGIAKSEATAFLTSLMPLIYADMIANGTGIHLGTPATAALVYAAVNSALVNIAAYGGQPGGIVLDLTNAGMFIAGAGAAFQPANALQISLYSPGQAIGSYLGYPVYVTPTDLANTAATPIHMAGIVWAKNGFAYAASGDAGGYLGMNVVPHPNDENGTNSIISKLCAGYKTLDANLVYYLEVTA